MSACANCPKPLGNEASITCDNCNSRLHVVCTGLQNDDRITRNKVRNVKIYCNRCTTIAEQRTALPQLFDNLAEDLVSKLEQKINDKFAAIKEKINNLQSSPSNPELFEEVANEAVERIIRSKNVIIRGLPESVGNVEAKIQNDTVKVSNILKTISTDAIPEKVIRLGKPSASASFH
ncbi:hypothetical protein Zmor_006840 [Zophobas morio]|uniref:Zinc finger PHD-type domain-containing protein n=1 Tax=Zophobas morio TaxID=2755281 RepID=A0AA38IWW6_9CUCU|nr:hypothetical protein Zmor_006840 [Zophobas morio]